MTNGCGSAPCTHQPEISATFVSVGSPNSWVARTRINASALLSILSSPTFPSADGQRFTMHHQRKLDLGHAHFRAEVAQFFSVDACFFAHNSRARLRSCSCECLMIGLVKLDEFYPKVVAFDFSDEGEGL